MVAANLVPTVIWGFEAKILPSSCMACPIFSGKEQKVNENMQGGSFTMVPEFFNSFGRITQEDCRFTAWFSAISGIFGRIAMLRKTAFLKGHPALVLRLYSALQISLYIFPLSPTMLDFIWPLLAAHWKKPFCVEKFCKNAKQSS